MAWQEVERDQGEPRVCLHHREGWTAVSFWDRTGDDRWSCASTVIAEGLHTFEAMVEIFRTRLPRLWARVTAAGPLVAHPGNVDPVDPVEPVGRLRVAVPEPVKTRVVVAADVLQEEDEPKAGGVIRRMTA
jgi:hypothetical protein